MIIEADNHKQTAVVISNHNYFFGSNNIRHHDYKMFVYDKDGINKFGDGFSKWHKLINKIKR